jgi:hypothetical protein
MSQSPNQVQDIYVSLEFTPNPNTLKYSVNRQLMERGTLQILNKADAEAKSPLAVKLFAIPGLAAVMVGKDFVTVTKTDEGDWDLVHKTCSTTIETHLGAGLAAVNESALPSTQHKGGESEIENRIKAILDTEVRPAVAMDGGDITFDRFEAGVVYL